MTDLEKMVFNGILKENEEVYLECKNHFYAGRISSGGKIIKTQYGEHRSLSLAAGVFFKIHESPEKKKLNPDGKYLINGWNHRKNWKGIPLKELRKKLDE